jgi:hypothetical protein
VADINRWPGYNIGWVMVEGEKRYFLAVDPGVESDHGGPSIDPSEGLADSMVALDARQTTLFSSSVSAYDVEREAA